MRVGRVVLAAVPLLALVLAASDTGSRAQPAVSLTSSCAKLRAALDKLNPDPNTLVTIEVIGKLTIAEFDGAITYMGMCAAPDPQVMCITYSLDEWKVGDVAVVAGGYARKGPDHVVLDPCLHYKPREEDMETLNGEPVFH